MWKVLKELLQCKTTSPNSIIFGTESVDNPNLIAEKFNIFFVDSIKVINSTIPTVASDFNNTLISDSSFAEFQQITKNQLQNKLPA